MEETETQKESGEQARGERERMAVDEKREDDKSEGKKRRK